MGRKRKAGAMLPEGVHVVMSRGRQFNYWRPGRGTERETAFKPTWHRLPDDTASQAFWAAVERAKAPTKPAEGKMAKMIQAYQASPHYGALRPSTRREYDRYLASFGKKMGSADPDDLAPYQFAAIRDGLGSTPAKANAYVRAISAMYVWGREAGHARGNPAASITKLKIGEWKPWPLWAWELVPLLRVELRLACYLALYTGQRLGDVLDMHMSRIQDKTVSVRQEKTDKFLRIPLHRELMPIIEECRQRGSLFLVSRVDGTQFSVDQFHAMWGREMVRDEVRRIREEGFVFHGLRKSATVKLAEAGCTEKQIQAVTGMSLPMIAHYSKEADQLMLAKEAIRKVERT